MNVKIVLFVAYLGFLNSVEAKDSYVVPKAELITYYHMGNKEPYVFFYPFGWSKTGKFLYFMEERPGPLPICETNYYAVIIDTKENEILWSHRITKEVLCEDARYKSAKSGSLEQVWPELSPILKTQIAKQEIEQSPQAVNYLPLSVISENIQFIIKKEFDAVANLLFYVKEATIFLDGKTIISVPLTRDVLDLDLQNYIQSPFAPHFAFIFNAFVLGQHYEKIGPYYLVAGANLEKNQSRNTE